MTDEIIVASDPEIELARLNADVPNLVALTTTAQDAYSWLLNEGQQLWQAAVDRKDREGMQALRVINESASQMVECFQALHIANAGALAAGQTFREQRNQMAALHEKLTEAIYDIDRSHPDVAKLAREVEHDLLSRWEEIGAQIEFQAMSMRIADANGQEAEVVQAFLTALEEGVWDGHPALGELFRMARETLIQGEEAQ